MGTFSARAATDDRGRSTVPKVDEATDRHPEIDAVFFDFGGVILSSPFDAFAAYEERAGLPRDAVRTVNATNSDRNAWARFERNEIGLDEFVATFEAEALGLGFDIDGREVLGCLDSELREVMVSAVRHVHRHFTTALLTNNVVTMAPAQKGEVGGPFDAVLAEFDVIVESSRVGVRKPEPAFYELACELANVAADRVVFLDDLGVNLKAARAMGMRTIKVGDPVTALTELGELLGLRLV